jgi:hypothetical protein
MMIRDLPKDMDDETVEKLKRKFDRLAEEGTRRDPPDEIEEEGIEEDA